MAKEEPKEKGGKEAEAAAEAAPKGKSKKKLFIIVGALVVLLLGAGVPLMMMGGGEEGKTAEDAEHAEAGHEHEKHLVSAPLDVFIVNLSETGAFLKVKFLLEYDHDLVAKHEAKLAAKHGGGAADAGGGGHGGGEKAGLPGYLGEREPMVRDTVIRILSSKNSAEVLSLAGKEKLKEEVIEGLNEAIAMEDSPVQNIYFTEFIIQ